MILKSHSSPSSVTGPSLPLGPQNYFPVYKTNLLLLSGMCFNATPFFSAGLNLGQTFHHWATSLRLTPALVFQVLRLCM